MARSTTAQEERTRDQMSRAFKDEKSRAEGWADWGMFTAHVVHGLIQEVADLRGAMREAGVAEPPNRDPFGR
jgi:hypothetical protein